jgi:hypothetical protein
VGKWPTKCPFLPAQAVEFPRETHEIRDSVLSVSFRLDLTFKLFSGTAPFIAT